jgi:hypothetical protein
MSAELLVGVSEVFLPRLSFALNKLTYSFMGAGGETEAGVEVDDERGSFAGGGFGPLLDPCRCFSNISTIYRGNAYLQEVLRSTLEHTTTALETSSRHYTIHQLFSFTAHLGNFTSHCFPPLTQNAQAGRSTPQSQYQQTQNKQNCLVNNNITLSPCRHGRSGLK